MRYFTKFLLVTLILCFSITGVQAQTKAEKLDSLLSMYNEYKIVNGVVLVAENGEILLEKGYGYADFDTKTPVTPENQFRIGSVTKEFVSMVIMQLVEEGKINLDDPMTKYLPEYRHDTGDRITIRELLNHTSGIKSYTNVPGWWRDSTKFKFTKDHMIKYAHSGDLEFEPGTDYNYNNTGYYLLGIIAERVAGVPYEDLIVERIMKPVGMTHSGIEREDNPPSNRANGYNWIGIKLEDDPYFYMPNALGAGDIYSTAGDLYKWDRALYTEKLLPEQYKKMMWTPYLQQYGFGWVISNANGTGARDSSTLIWHTGGINGFNTMFARFVDEDRTVIILNNTGSTRLNEMTRNIRAILDGKEAEYPKQPVLFVLEKWLNDKGYAGTVDYFRNNIENIKEEYMVREGDINVYGYSAMQEEKNIDKALAIFEINVIAFPESFNPYDSYAEALMNKGENEKAIEYYKKSLELNPANEGAVTMLKKLGVDYDKPTDLTLSNEVLSRYTGKYQLAPTFFIEITVDGTQIFEQATGQQKFEIFPTTETDFYLKVVSARIVFKTDESGKVTGMTLYQGGQEIPGDKVE